MRIVKIILLLCLCFSFLEKANSQSGAVLNNIDSTSIRIDSLSSSFERFTFNLNEPGVAMGYRIHYIDTLNKQYKKIVYKSDIDTLIKIFYFKKDELIEIKIEKNTGFLKSVKLQFSKDSLVNRSDPYELVTDIRRLVAEAKRYYNRVRY